MLYGLVRVYLATFLAHTERTYAAPLRKYGVDTFDDYLACRDATSRQRPRRVRDRAVRWMRRKGHPDKRGG